LLELDNQSLKLFGEVFWGHFVIVNVSVFSTGCESISVGREIHGMHRAEMPMNIGQLIAENQREHLHFEATSISASLRHIFSVLAASCEDVELLVLRIVEEG